MALVLTLLAISFMIAVTVQLFTSVNWQMQAAVNLKDSVRLDALTRSGLSLIRAALRADAKKNQYDSVHDDWNAFDAEKLSSLFGGNQLSISVTDLSGKIQVNALVTKSSNPQQANQQIQEQKNLWVRFLTSQYFEVETDDAEIIVDSIIDWIDENDAAHAKGEESGFYQSMDPPYTARNAPMVYLEELLFIQGMTNELFYGNEEHAGIKDYLTVLGDTGEININTAQEPVLLALAPGMDEAMVKSIIEFREDEEHEPSLGTVDWLQNVPGVAGFATPNPSLLTVSSNYFQVTSTATVNEISRQGTGILQRLQSQKGEKLLKWEVR